MRIITIMMGTLFSVTGIYLIANGGLTFMSVAFIVGLLFAVAGVIECLSYSGYRGEDETKSWILIDGTCTFMLGVLILMNKLSAEAAVPLVLGLWILFSGIRNFVRAWEKIDVRGDGFYDHLIIGFVNIVLGLYAFFDQDLFDFSTITLVGIYMLSGGVNIAHVGATIKIRKPEFLKTKEEKLEEAAAKAAEAHQAAKEAIRFAKETKAELKVIEQTPAEEMDRTLAPKPGTEVPAETAESQESEG
ncbi:MAG: HdeD family acid-resistance protein [Anaerovoracaceae bacterium]